MKELEKRLMEATAPDRELDRAIKLALSPRVSCVPLWLVGSTAWLMSPSVGDEVGDTLAPFSGSSIIVEPFTSSLDAAVTLCERLFPTSDLDFDKTHTDEGVMWLASIFREDLGHKAYQGEKQTPALALCLAIVRATPHPTPAARGGREDKEK
jgi:hypothetical protein